MKIDLDSARKKREAARREAQSEGPVVTLGGEELALAPEMPYEVLECLRGLANPETAAASLIQIMEILLGEHAATFKAHNPSIEDVNEFVSGAMEAYGLDAPLDSPAS